jgi:hypothetical protein
MGIGNWSDCRLVPDNMRGGIVRGCAPDAGCAGEIVAGNRLSSGTFASFVDRRERCGIPLFLERPLNFHRFQILCCLAQFQSQSGQLFLGFPKARQSLILRRLIDDGSKDLVV